MRLPGLGPKTARRIWQELGITTVADLRAAAEAQRLRDLAGLGREVRGEDPRRARQGRRPPRGRTGALLGHGAAEAARGRGGASPRTRRRCEVSIAGSARRFRETVRDLDLIATATDAPRAARRVLRAAVGGRGRRAAATTKATVVGQDGLRFDLRVVPPECVREPAPALHRLEGPQRRAARGRRPARALGLRVRHRRGRDAARCTRSRPRRRSTRFLGYEWIPPELRENGGELEAARSGELPELVELGDLRGDLHTHTTWSDGKDSLEAMVGRGDRAAATTTTRSATTRTGCATGGSSSRTRRSTRCNAARAAQDPEGHRGEHPRRTATLDVADEDLATLDWVVASVHNSFDKRPDRARARGDGEPVRRLHRPRHEPQDRQAATPSDDRRRARDREGARDRARSSRSTRSPTGSTSPTCTRARRARPA